jgi:hypothetical protein
LKATFTKLGHTTRVFIMEGAKVEDRDGDLYVDGKLVAWFNECDRGWFISGTFPGRPKDVTYWDRMVVS